MEEPFSQKWLNQFFSHFDDNNRPVFKIDKNTHINLFFSKILMKETEDWISETGCEIVIRKRLEGFKFIDYYIYIDDEIKIDHYDRIITEGE